MTHTWTLVLAALLALSGCATIDRISGSGSMEIDVEVYKGPLAQDPWTQWGELRGVVTEAFTAAEAAKGFAVGVFHEEKCEPKGLVPPAPTVPPQSNPIKAYGDTVDAICVVPIRPPTQSQGCDSLWGMICATHGLGKAVAMLDAADNALANVLAKKGLIDAPGDPAPLEQTKREVRQALQEVVRVATRMRGTAFFGAAAQLSSPVNERRARTALTNIAVAMSEYANQMATRADALLQQMAGPDRRELPLSLLLRNTNPTDFVNLYIWNRAAGPALLADMVLRFPRAFNSEETADRVRGYERLFADYNWSNVNTVYASGQGNVTMAFIKDDIGNWSLKNFDNDPAELLQAYVNVGKAVLVEAAKAASAATGAGAGAQALGQVAQLTELANRVAFGRTSTSQATVGGLDVGALHQRVARELDRLKAAATAEAAALNDAIAANDRKIDKLVIDRDAARARAVAARNKMPAVVPGEAADLEREAQRNQQQIFELDQQIALLDSQIKTGAAVSAAGQPTPEQRLITLRAQRDAVAKVREKNLNDARQARALAKQADDFEAEAAPHDATAKSLDEVIAATKKETEAKNARLAMQGQATARAAREILNRHGKIVELLQEGIATSSPAGGGSSTPALPAAPAVPAGAGGLLRQLPR